MAQQDSRDAVVCLVLEELSKGGASQQRVLSALSATLGGGSGVVDTSGNSVALDSSSAPQGTRPIEGLTHMTMAESSLADGSSAQLPGLSSGVVPAGGEVEMQLTEQNSDRSTSIKAWDRGSDHGDAGSCGADAGKEDPQNETKMQLCRVCGMVLDSSQDLLEHAQQHLSQKEGEPFTCHVCAVSFQLPNQLVQHLQAHSVMEIVSSSRAVGQQEEGNGIACTHCSEKLQTSQLLYQHILTVHHSTDKLNCPLCMANFQPHQKDAFVVHLNDHVAAPTLTCNVCGKKFRLQRSLWEHMKCHQPRQQYLCYTCGKTFVNKYNYNLHVKMHEDKDEVKRSKAEAEELLKKEGFACTICGKLHRTRGHLTTHMKYHVKNGPILHKLYCATCNMTFATKTDYSKHLDAHKEQKIREGYPCPLCTERLETRVLKIKHIRQAHPDYRPYKCSKCEKAYKSDSSLYQHELSHEGKRAYQCPHCPRQLWNKACLKDHILIKHSGLERKKTVPCHICGRMFYNKHHLQNHMRFKHDTPPVKCRFCPKVYRDKKSLTDHETLHTGKLLYECSDCGAKLRTQNLLKSHKRREHGDREKIWKCRDCDAAFELKASLAWHVRHVHFKCFVCLEHFPDRRTASQHKCALFMSRADLYLKENDKECKSVKTTIDKHRLVGVTADSHDTFLEIVLAAEGVQKDQSEPPTIVSLSDVENSHSVAYTVIHDQGNSGTGSIKLPRLKLRERRKKTKGFRRYKPLVPVVDADGYSTHIGANVSGSVGVAATDVSTVDSFPHTSATPISEHLSKNMLQAEVEVSTSSAHAGTSTPVSSHLLIPLSSTDHSYHSTLQADLVLEGEVPHENLLSELVKGEVSESTPGKAFSEPAGPFGPPPPPTIEIALTDFFACLNDTDTAKCETNKNTTKPQHTLKKKNAANPPRKRGRPRSKAVTRKQRKTTSAKVSGKNGSFAQSDETLENKVEVKMEVEEMGSCETGPCIKQSLGGKNDQKPDVDGAKSSQRKDLDGENGSLEKVLDEENNYQESFSVEYDGRNKKSNKGGVSEESMHGHEADDSDGGISYQPFDGGEVPAHNLKQPVTLQMMKAGNHSVEQKSGLEQNKILTYVCAVCGEKFCSLSTLLTHLRTSHNFPEIYSCQHCFFLTNSFSQLIAHFEQHAKQHSNNIVHDTPVSSERNLLNTPQTFGPLWEATYTTKDRSCSVFVNVSVKNKPDGDKSMKGLQA